MLDCFALNFVTLLHFGFVVFAVLGGILTAWWRKIIWCHIPAVLWAAWIEFSGWTCPLSPLEDHLRMSCERPGYPTRLLDVYVWPILYPEGLTRELQIVFGVLVLAVNVAVYRRVFSGSLPSFRKITHCLSSNRNDRDKA